MILASFLLAAVLFLLSELDVISGFTLGWAGFMVAFVAGSAFVLRGLFEKNLIPLKKLNIYFGAGLYVVALLLLITEIAIEDNLVVPIIAVIVTAALLLGFLAVGGKKYDQGDNKKKGYKSWRELTPEERERRRNGQE